MKILQIAPAWVDTPPKDYGGTEWVVANLIKGLADYGYDVTLFATKHSQVEGKTKYIYEQPLLKQGLPWNAALPALIHYHEAFKHAQDYDVVHAHLSSETDMIVLPFLANLFDKNICAVVTIHSRWPFDTYSNTDEIFLKMYADKILAVNISASMQKTLPKEFRDGGFVHNSLDITKMRFSPKGGNYLTWLGKIIPEKGTAEAIKTAKLAGEQFVFAGIVDKQNAKSVKYFESEVKPLIDDHQVKYLGPADLRLKNKLLGGAKAFLNPIDWEEPFGMVMVESMATGTPVISYARGAAPEVIKHGESGFLTNDRAGILKSLKKIQKIDRRRCRRYVEDRFSPKSAAREYLNLYRRELILVKSELTDTVIKPLGAGQLIGKFIIPNSHVSRLPSFRHG